MIFFDRAIGGVVRAGLKNLKFCMRLAIMLYFEVIKNLVLGEGAPSDHVEVKKFGPFSRFPHNPQIFSARTANTLVTAQARSPL